jgi:phage terminase large subunit-like protein
MKAIDKKALDSWDIYRKQVMDSTSVNATETAVEQRKRIEKLEANPEAWFKYYFPKFAFAEPADFHKAATKRVLNNKRWYEVRAWSRELAKSTRTMMEVLYMALTGKRYNVLMISNSNDNAERLLKPYKINLEANQRIINDYGKQQSFGDWASSEFITTKGVSFRGIGAGQSPRGSRAEEKRIDTILIDDFDTDEECKNPRIVKEKWEWLEQAVIPTVSISGEYTFIFCGNIIAKYCCITEAIKKANHTDIINIRDKVGKSSWHQKNSEKDIDDILSLISYISQQKEYFNNPISQGTVFKEMHYKKMPPLSQYKFLVCYIDLSYKSSAKNDYKAAVLMGKWKTEYHILKCFVKQGTTSTLALGLVDMNNWVNGKCPIYWVAEDNFLQDIILKELHEAFDQLNCPIIITGDSRKKIDKFTRIESALQPLNDNSRLFLNEAEADNPHMQTLEEQFKALEPGSKTHDDAPDASEGAKQIIDSKQYQEMPMIIGVRDANPQRY